MAIHDSNTTTDVYSAAGDKVASVNQNNNTNNQTPPVAHQPVDGGNGRFGTYNYAADLTGFTAIKTALSQSYAGESGNVVATKLMNRLKEREQFARDNNRNTLEDIQFFLVDQESMDVDYSGIIVTYPLVKGSTKVVAVHTLIVEDNEDPAPPAEYDGPGGAKYYVPQTPGDSYNQAYYDRVMMIVKRHFPSSEWEIVDAHASVVYNEVNPEVDAEIDEILRYVANALRGSIDINYGIPEAEEGLVKFIKDNRGALKASVSLQPGANVYQPDGLMARADFTVNTAIENLDSRKGRNRKGQLLLASVSGFVDLTYIEPEPQHPMIDPTGRVIQPPPPKFYQATAIITNISSPNRQTISTVFMGLANATILSEHNLFLELFRPQRGVKGDLDIRDIGAVGYDIPDLTSDRKRRKIDTKSKEFIDQQGFERLVSTIISPNLAFAIDIPEVGPLSWMLVLLRDAAGASGPKVQAQAQAQIVQVCNELSDNHFSSFYNGQPIIESAQRRVILGVYTEAETQRKVDLRTVDYLAILNEFGSLEDAVLLYDKAANDFTEPDAKRVHDMVELLSEAVFKSHDIRVRGYAQRMFFTAAFIEAFTQAMRKSGAAAMFSNLPNVQQEMFRTKANRFANYTVDSRMLGNLYQPTVNQQGQGGGLGGALQRHWQRHYM